MQAIMVVRQVQKMSSVLRMFGEETKLYRSCCGIVQLVWVNWEALVGSLFARNASIIGMMRGIVAANKRTRN